MRQAVRSILSPHGARPWPRRMALLAVLLLLGPDAAPAEAVEPPHPGNVYVRTRRDIAGTIRYLELEADRIDATQVLVAFDVATFDPPPGLTEFTLEYPFFEDLDAWLGALAGWAKRTPRALRGTSSLAPRTLDLKKPGATGRLKMLVRSKWWAGERPAKLPSAALWMNDALRRTEDSVRAAAAHPKRMLVLLTSSVTPERWVRAATERGYESKWRGKLREIGTYFEEGRVGSLLNGAGCRLYVVAPEARFGDFSPYVEIPELPWAARPRLPVSGSRSRAGRGGRRRGGGRALDDLLRDVFPDPEERRRFLEGLGEGEDEAPVTGPRRAPPTSGLSASHDGGLRFQASTPTWFHMCGGTVPFNNHAPSGYGIWPYARAAAKTGGKYIFYPFPKKRWLDDCPANYGLINDLAPELIPRARFLSNRRGDAALNALARASALVIEDTPWADTGFQHRSAGGWTAFQNTSPLRLEKKCYLRRKPFDDALQNSEEGMARLGQKLRDETLPQYDRALDLLDAAVLRCRNTIGQGVHPRSHASLLLARFWFAMSAFHLDAYALYALEIDRFIPEAMGGHVDRIVVTYVPTIRLSDVLDAYDGRELTLANERRYKRWVPENAPGYQGNILDIPVEQPDFRARRNVGSVLRHLDPRLRRRALRMMDAARAVMRVYGRTGWGWTTYYSEAYTFIFKPVPVQRGHRPTRGGGKTPPRPTTPQGGGGGQGGSNPGGPGTGGR